MINTENDKFQDTSNMTDIDAAQADNISPGQLRILKIMVLSSAVILVVGFIGLASAITYKILNLDGKKTENIFQTASPSSEETIKLAIPKGASVQNVDIDTKHLAIQYKAEKTSGIIIMEIATGQVIRHVQLNETAPK